MNNAQEQMLRKLLREREHLVAKYVKKTKQIQLFLDITEPKQEEKPNE